MTDCRIAVLVDGDNISPVHAPRILQEARGLGRVDFCRVYLSGMSNSDWLRLPGYRTMHAGSGKNAADLLICIDAMSLAMPGDIDAFVVATSDGDFTHLAQRLCEMGLQILGIGEAKTPGTFRAACRTFIQLPQPETPTAPVRPQALVPAAKPSLSRTDQRICDCIRAAGNSKKGMKITDLGNKMKADFSFLIGETQEKSWRVYLEKRPALFDLDPKGTDARVRVAVAVPASNLLDPGQAAKQSSA